MFIMKHIFVFLASILLLAACSKDEPLAPSTVELAWHHATMTLAGGIADYDASRAISKDWADGDRLFIHLALGSGTVHANATYSAEKQEWGVEYFGDIAEGSEGKCQVHFFKGAGIGSSLVSLSDTSAVYADTAATYTFSAGRFAITSTLKPSLGRIRFKGTPDTCFTVYGFNNFKDYNPETNTFSPNTTFRRLTVGADGFTPYVYGFYPADVAKKVLSVRYDDFSLFTMILGTRPLSPGASGVLEAPTALQHQGWDAQDNTSPTFYANGVAFTMIAVEGGSFMMGDSTVAESSPVHKVTLSNYFIGETEVTQALWYAVMKAKPTPSVSYDWDSGTGLGDNIPAYFISREHCDLFIEKLNAITFLNFRLPTEAEWEFAARGGNKSHGYKYSGSNNSDQVAASRGSGGFTYSNNYVKTKLPNELGIYDMTGNVEEWCYDRYAAYTAAEATNPTGPDDLSITKYVLRGGFIGSIYTVYERTSEAVSYNMGYFVGLRLALTTD